MNFTDIFIKRPVLATVVSLLIFLLGLRAIYDLPVREFPQLTNTVITITTVYPGANADVIQGFITIPIQKAIAGSQGIDYITSTSDQSLSTIKVYLQLNYDPDKAFTDIDSKVAQVRDDLPQNAQDPSLEKAVGSQIDLMYMGFNSKQMSPEQITEYLSRVVQPKIQTVSGVAEAEILGDKTFAMRIWLNPQKMAAYHVTPNDVVNAIEQNNFQSAAGQTKGEYLVFNVNAHTDLHNVEQFKQLIIKSVNGTLIRMQDIGTVELGSKNYDSSVIFNGEQAVFIGIQSIPTANPLTVISDVKKLFPSIVKNLPPALTGQIVYDATKYIRASIHEVVKTILEATLIVVIVIFLFLGSLRSVIIPVVTIPLSLVGVCTFMLFLGYSINLLTLLAMVLAIGLVVDDAIVVVENIHRHIEDGMKPFHAALQGAREIATPIIAMTITLAAVYAPIGFMGGLTGTLFKEFAFTLAGTVIISGVIALTLSPMMCSRLLQPEKMQVRFVQYLDKGFDNLKNFYQRRLTRVLDYRPVTLLFAAVVLVSCYFLYTGTSKELAPDEDQSVLFISATAPEYANIDYVSQFTAQFNSILKSFPETQDYFVINGASGVNNVIAGVILKPWGERKRSQQELNPLMQEKLSQIAGLKTVVFPLPSLPTGDDNLPLQFVINSTGDYASIFKISQQIENAAHKSGLFLFTDNTLKFDKPQLEVEIDRSKAAQLGISMQDIGNALATALGGDDVNLFSMEGYSYKVIPQVSRKFRLNPKEIAHIYVKTASGELVPLSTVISLKYTIQPNTLTQFQQLNSATIQGLMTPGKTLGEGLEFLQQQADNLLPKTMTYDYAGQSRQLIQEGHALIFAFFFAIVVIFLVLAAQFESFRDPLIILISVPMSICGALIPLYLGAATINIYTQVGLITLIGLISKHGILMVDFANKSQIREGLSVREAIEKAASIRLRPILMTTAAMVVGVVPLILATGAGAKSRFNIGLVIATGMLIGTLFTLFVVPTMYTLLAQKRIKIEKRTEDNELGTP